MSRETTRERSNPAPGGSNFDWDPSEVQALIGRIRTFEPGEYEAAKERGEELERLFQADEAARKVQRYS